MKIIERFKDWRLAKLENKLKQIEKRNNLSNNPFLIGMNTNIYTDKSFSLRLLENYVWYSSSLVLLRNFYNKSKLTQRVYGDDDSNFFWANATNEMRKVHSKLPAIISDRMVDVLFGAGVDIDLEVYDETNEVNELSTTNASEILSEILKENDFQNLLNVGGSGESWSGGIAAKVCFDTELSKLPIIEIEDQRNFELVTKRKRVIAIIFKRWYEKKKSNSNNIDKYVLHETYTTNDDGKAVIIYELFYKKSNGGLKKVPLQTIEETAELEEVKVFEYIDGMLAIYKPNKTPNKEFIGSEYGESDYAGCYSLFDTLDEIISTMAEETRANKTIEYIPDSMIPKDRFGNDLPFNQFERKYKKISSKDNSEDDKIEFAKPNLQVSEHLEEYKSTLSLILNTVGFSPITIGVTGLEAINASDASQRERERVTLRTRDNKTKLWGEFLSKLTVMIFKAYRQMRINGIIYEGLGDVIIDESNCNVKVSFGEYINEPLEKRLVTYGEAKIRNSISYEEMVEQIWRNNKTEEQKKLEVDRLKMEQGMSLSNEDNLLL